MKKRHWQVWEGNNPDNVIFVGSHSKCLVFYKKNGGTKADLHIGYDIF